MFTYLDKFSEEKKKMLVVVLLSKPNCPYAALKLFLQSLVKTC